MLSELLVYGRLEDMLATLPPADRDELLALVGQAGTPERDTETGGTP